MKGLSKHTLLMNKMIGLAKPIHNWPSPLKDLGFKVEGIEPKIPDDEGKIVNPDLLFSSNKLIHALIVECKSGKNISDKDRKQIIKYIKMDPQHVRPKVNVYDPAKLGLDICFAVEEDNKEIINKIEEYHKFPVIIFSNTNISKRNDFKRKELNDKFSTKIDLSIEKPPTYLYPFSDQDGESTIALFVFQEILSIVLKNKYRDELEIDVEKMLKKILEKNF